MKSALPGSCRAREGNHSSLADVSFSTTVRYAAEAVGEIRIVAFDASEEQIAALKRGSVQALIVQNPFQMGYQGVRAAIDYIEGRPVAKRIDTGVTVVTLDNIDDPEVQKLLNPI